ncbi:HdeD family acid-resistance protein [Xanthobacteraceae bacterium A53D]
MIQLALLLVGARTLRRRWWVLGLLGAALILLAAAIMVDLVDGITVLALRFFAIAFLLEGVIALGAVAGAKDRMARILQGVKAGLLLLIGVLIIDNPFQNTTIVAWMFGIGFLIDGLARLATVLVIRFRGWRLSAVAGAIEIALAGVVFAHWLPNRIYIPLCISLLLALSGITILRLALWLRNEPEEVALYALPMFGGGRAWNDNAPVLIGTDTPEPPPEGPLTVHVWTPTGSAEVTSRRPVLDRYLGAIDVNGDFSTGHAALDYQPHVYISHWPGQEIDATTPPLQLLNAGKVNDIPGRFLGSYAEETAEWEQPADRQVEFTRFSPRRLRAYWAGYRQDNTYNLTNRNCSVAVAGALDSALEGVLDCRYPFIRLLALQFNPDIWTASYLRSRAHAQCWTPGLLLDYAQAMKRIVDSSGLSWAQRASAFVRRLRADRHSQATPS